MAKRRKQGEGTLRLRKDGRWEGRVVVGYDDKGLPITKNVTAKTKEECVIKLERLREQYGKPTEKINPEMSFGEWIDFLNRAKEEDYYELFLLELATGMRRGEILALKWSDLNFTTGELRIERQVNVIHGEIIISEPKTKSSIRTVTLPKALLEILSEHRKNIDSEWIFPSPIDDVKPRNPPAVRKRLQLILERAGCPKVRFLEKADTKADFDCTETSVYLSNAGRRKMIELFESRLSDEADTDNGYKNNVDGLILSQVDRLS